MNFSKVYLILGLAVLSFAQLDVRQLFQVDVDTDDEGGCNYAGAFWLNKMLQDCIRYTDRIMDAVDDYLDPNSPYHQAAINLIDTFFKPRTGQLRNDVNFIGCMYFA